MKPQHLLRSLAPVLPLLALLLAAPNAALSQAAAGPTVLAPEARPRLAQAAGDSLIAPWQRDIMLRLARTGSTATSDSSAAGLRAELPAHASGAADGAWTQLTTGTPTGGRYVHSTIYDPVRDRMVVFGGGTSISPYTLNDVWVLSLAGTPTWTQLAPSGTPPSARYYHSAIYDPGRDRMVVFGGADNNPTYYNDVWVLSLADMPSWTPLTPSGTPPSRRWGHSAIYDPGRDCMVVFGGHDGSYRNDVWVLSLAGTPAWTQLTPSDALPSARAGHSAIYDPVRDRMVVFGGPGLHDVWALSLGNPASWTQLTPLSPTPSASYLHSVIYDRVSDRMVVFGGIGSEYVNDVWVLSLAGTPAWTQLTPSGTLPSARVNHSAIYDPVRGRMVVFGGVSISSNLNDVWALGWSTTDVIAPTIHVLSPSSGEVLVNCTTHPLTWSATDNVGVRSVDLYLSRAGPSGPWELLAAGIANTGTFNWLVSGAAADNSACLRVDARDYNGNAGNAMSAAAFTVRPALQLVALVVDSGKIGDAIKVSGHGLSQATAVRIGGVTVPNWVASSDDTLRVTLPADALSGLVEVDSPCGTVQSAAPVSVLRDMPLQTTATPNNNQNAWLAAVGLPLASNLTTATGVPVSALGFSGNVETDWRVSSWDPVTNRYVNTDSLRIGRGYWIQTKDAWTRTVSGTVTRGDADIANSMVWLGWHQLGNPYPDTISIADFHVRLGSGVYPFTAQSAFDQKVWIWKSDQLRYASADSFAIPVGGTFWVRVLTSDAQGQLLIGPPGSAGSAPGAPAVISAAADWSVRLTARQGSWVTTPVVLGVAALQDGRAHPLTALAPPDPPVSRLTLALGRAPGEEYLGRILDRAEASEWQLQVKDASAPGEVQLVAEAEGLPAGARLLLTDAARGLELELVPGQPLVLAATGVTRTFRIRMAMQSGLPVTQIVERIRPYPNPFRGQTGFMFAVARATELRVGIYDLAGRLVRTLARRADGAGEYVLVWDGADAAGRALTAGVYFARCRGGSVSADLRIVMLK